LKTPALPIWRPMSRSMETSPTFRRCLKSKGQTSLKATTWLQRSRNLRDLTHEQSMGLQRLVFGGPWTALQKGDFAYGVLVFHTFCLSNMEIVHMF
jgi:hypothetical protein